ncbi:MAG: 1,4-alpha-glucan branching protein GlgB [Deltaproteobacteria bacterium]|nr:1,4-alpha-glucan branching protein GlgB [Deltaproteobacteria bacterium]
MSDAQPMLAELAELYGVQTSYEDVIRGNRQVKVESLLAVLRSLGAAVASLDDVPKAIRERREELWRRVIEPVAVAWDGQAPEISVRLPASVSTGRWVATLETEGGEKRRAAGTIASLPVTASAEVEGTKYVARTLSLAGEIPHGYHRLRLELPHGTFDAHVIAAASRAFVPQSVHDGRAWGTFMPLYSLHTARSRGIADLEDLGALLDFTRAAGGELVGTLPILASYLDEPCAPSPYTPMSRLFWNELYLALDLIPELEGSARAKELYEKIEAGGDARAVDYKGVMAAKRRVLEILAPAFFAAGAKRREAFDAFCVARPQVHDYAKFRAAVELTRKTWHAWTTKQRDGELTERDYDAGGYRYHLFVQWLMHQQLETLIHKRRDQGVGLYLDLPLGVHPDGYDVWRERAVFFRDLAAGAPPDALSMTGQNWGFPGLHPEQCRQQGYRYVASCIRQHAQVAAALRIDHVMGLHRLFLIPTGMDAKDGAYVRYPADELYAVLSLESNRGRCLIVGEDLGTVPPAVRPTMARHGIQRMYVGQFELRDEPFAALTPPPPSSFASFDTHDTATFAGYFQGRDLDDQVELGGTDAATAEREKTRRAKLKATLTRFLRRHDRLVDEEPELHALLSACLVELAASDAAGLMVTLEDLWLEAEPQNVPGTLHERPNWSRRARLALEAIRERPEIMAALQAIDTARKTKSPKGESRRELTAPQGSRGRGKGKGAKAGVQAVLPFSVITDNDLFLFNEGTHYRLYERLGSHVATSDGVDGTAFAVWAPDANYVSVVGDFNGWSTSSHPLKPRASSGIWEGFIPGVGHGEVYKYHIGSRYNGYQVEKADPFARFHETPPKTASRVWRHSYQWKDDAWMKERGGRQGLDKPMSIYEVHLGSWMRVPEADNRWLSYRELAPRLAAHVREMGFTHVELLPVMEHPFYASWGYQVTGYFAPTSRYGTPEDLMFLIDTLHQNGIGVLLDWVPAHFPSDQHGLGYFDGTHLFEHADSRKGFHPDWQSYIFNYGRNEVRSFLLSSAMFWLDLFHADGLRVDGVASMLYLDYSRKEGEWIPNQFGGRENLEAMSLLRQLNEVTYKQFPDIQNIAEESTAWPMVSKPTYVGGLGFGFKWDMGWMHDTLAYMSRDPIHRRYHHNGITFRMLYAFTENFVLPLSHDEVVHGKGSLLSKMPGDVWQKFANLRLLFATLFAQAGKKLLFMGAELGQWNEWYHDASLDWHLLQAEPHRGVKQLVSDLNRLYRDERALYEHDARPEGFEWVDCNDADTSVYTLIRKGHTTTAKVLVALNMTPVPRADYRIGVPHPGLWREVLNTDAREYGGSGLGNAGGVNAEVVSWHNRPFSVRLTLPPLAAVFLRHPGE